MSFEDFAGAAAPPPGASPALQALWYDARGDWGRAHQLSQQEAGRNGAWVHAYLHRKEGDAMNAGYWYSLAGKTEGTGDLDAERAAIVQTLLRGG